MSGAGNYCCTDSAWPQSAAGAGPQLHGLLEWRGWGAMGGGVGGGGGYHWGGGGGGGGPGPESIYGNPPPPLDQPPP